MSRPFRSTGERPAYIPGGLIVMGFGGYLLVALLSSNSAGFGMVASAWLKAYPLYWLYKVCMALFFFVSGSVATVAALWPSSADDLQPPAE